MFPLRPRASQADQILDDLVVDHVPKESNFIRFSTGSNDKQMGETMNSRLTGQRRTNSRCESNIMRRDIERKRRQEMSSLNVSLRSLLPLKHIKGKRTACDKIQEAVNHIKNMQKNIQEMRSRRDKLKNLCNLSGSKVAETSNGSDDLPNCVTASIVSDGLEILISRCIESSDSGLSRILAELLEHELDVISCVSTRTQGGILHKILVEARDMTSLHVSVLQDKLTSAIK